MFDATHTDVNKGHKYNVCQSDNIYVFGAAADHTTNLTIWLEPVRIERGDAEETWSAVMRQLNAVCNPAFEVAPTTATTTTITIFSI